MNGHDDFERILQTRFIPEMRSNLPDRIIAASLQVDRKKPHKAVSWFSDLWDGFVLPQPAFAIAVALFIGVIIGLNPDANANANTDTNFYMQSQVQADLGDIL